MARDLPAADPVADAVRASLWFKLNEKLVRRNARRPGLLDAAQRDQTSDKAWNRAAGGVRRLLRCL
jgi:hypothetical protein